MNRSLAAYGLLAFAACAIGAAQAARWHNARERHAAARRVVAAASADAAELARLQAAAETRIFGEPPAEDFVERVNRTLGTIGLPPTTASNITREADRGVSGADAGRRRRDMRIELRPITPPDLGRFLAAWNADNPAWTARQITLRKGTDRRAAPEEYHASLVFSAEYTQIAAGPPTAGQPRE